MSKRGTPIRHGQARVGKITSFYRKWESIKRRCYNKKQQAYKYYGARGIRCEWGSFEDFEHDMYESYFAHSSQHGEKNTTIDRIDSRGAYSKKNCRWATQREQCRNTRRNVFLVFNGKNLCISEWAEIIGIDPDTLWARIHRGWNIKKALSTPLLQNYATNR